jgi:hypothetical protein
VLLPTLVVTAWAVQRSHPVYRNRELADWQQLLSSRLGLKVEIQRLAYPSYWVARFEGLEVSDPETKTKLLVCRSLEASRTKTTWIVEASQPELELSQLATFWEVIDGRLLREFTTEPLPCEIEIGELTLRAGTQAQTVTQVFGMLRPIPNGSEMTLEFRLAGVDTPQPCRLVMRRKRDVTPPRTEWEFDSAGIALPCSLLADRIPAFQALGPEARFVGTARGEIGATELRGEVKGRFLQVDLATLVTQHSVHKLTGLADVTCQLQFHNQRIEELRGSIDSRGGYVSESLLTAAREHLRLGVESEEPVPAQDGLVAYRRLAAEFSLSAEGLSLAGTADPARAGVILANSTRALLLDPTEQPLPASAVIRTLVPQPEYQVPAAKESLPLLQLLPAPAASSATKEPRVKVRFVP